MILFAMSSRVGRTLIASVLLAVAFVMGLFALYVSGVLAALVS